MGSLPNIHEKIAEVMDDYIRIIKEENPDFNDYIAREHARVFTDAWVAMQSSKGKGISYEREKRRKEEIVTLCIPS